MVLTFYLIILVSLGNVSVVYGIRITMDIWPVIYISKFSSYTCAKTAHTCKIFVPRYETSLDIAEKYWWFCKTIRIKVLLEARSYIPRNMYYINKCHLLISVIHQIWIWINFRQLLNKVCCHIYGIFSQEENYLIQFLLMAYLMQNILLKESAMHYS